MIVRICEYCGQEITKYDQRSKRTFCSRDCYHAWTKGVNNPNWRGGDVQFSCQWCGKLFVVRRDRLARQSGKYCSRECFNAFVVSIAMSTRQVNVAKNAIKRLTYWLRQNTYTLIDWKVRFGYFPDEFKERIESLWKLGMTWENYGVVWCLDHIKAVQFFEFTNVDDADFKTCFALDNIQPMFITENLLKGRRDKSNDVYWRR